MLHAGQMHGAAFALAQADLTTKELTETGIERRTARHHVVMSAVGTQGVVPALQGGCHPHGHRLLPYSEVHRAVNVVLEE